MDSLTNLLAHRRRDEPPEIAAIKQYVREQFNSEVAVTIRPRDIVVQAPSAALVSSLRLRIVALQAASGSDKPIVLRIGSR